MFIPLLTDGATASKLSRFGETE